MLATATMTPIFPIVTTFIITTPLLPLRVLLDLPEKDLLLVLPLGLLSDLAKGLSRPRKLLILGLHLVILDLMPVDLLSQRRLLDLLLEQSYRHYY